jgi:hypothetical protein
MSSDKQVQTNRKNSQRSTGPRSPDGKDWSRRNAVKSGLFSKELVVLSAGERPEDFDALLMALRDQFPVNDILSGLLLQDAAALHWRLQRVRRYETAQIRMQCDTAPVRRLLERSSEITALKSQFMLDYTALRFMAPLFSDREARRRSLEETRSKLARTSLGVGYLLDQVVGISKQVELDGYLTPEFRECLPCICGIGDTLCHNTLSMNDIVQAELSKTKDHSAKIQQMKQGLLDMLELMIKAMDEKKNLLEEVESLEESAYLSSLVMPPVEALEKVHRVEPALRRSFFKTLDVLLKVLYQKDDER